MTTPSHRWHYEGPGVLRFDIRFSCPACGAELLERVARPNAVQVCEHCGNPT